ncbi:MAG TPA: hypothetical protein VGI11_12995 [Variovorax sp.]
MPLPSLSPRERALLALCVLLAVVAVFGPSVPASLLAGSPFAANPPASGLPDLMGVLSSLPMAAVGVWGLCWLRWLDRAHEQAQDAALMPQAVVLPPVNALDCAWMFFAGLILTAAGAAFYHLQPDSMRLAADRAGIAVAFAGLVGFAVCERVSVRAGWPAAWFTLAGGLLAAVACFRTGNALPWALVQFGGLSLMLALSLARPVAGALGLKFGWAIFVFLLAKTFELLDHAVVEATHQLLSGFSLKHLAAAGASMIVLNGLQAMGRQTLRHNSGVAVTA